MDLFEEHLQTKLEKEAPLALRMRPRILEEFVGQEEIVGQGTVLRKAIKEDKLGSLILYGPAGVGKSSLARVITNLSAAVWEDLSATAAGLKDVRKVIGRARERLALSEQKTILFIDEFHRFNKTQQDALLPAVEQNLVILIGATTENPYFEVNSPLISRCRIFQLRPLTTGEIELIMKRALKDKERGLGKYKIKIQPRAMNHLVKVANGDARSALNALELATMTTPPNKQGVRQITLKLAEDAIQKKALTYDRAGDAHYNTISAFIKSMRGSDPDATLYWLARMVYAGEDPKFIARRIIIAASEDIGLADSKALEVAVAAARAVEFVGLPEARLNLAHAALYLATAPKSNSVICGIDKAMKDVEGEEAPPVPQHLRNGSYPGAKKLGHGKGYKYPHSFPGHYIKQDYLPSQLRGKRYYSPSKSGHEKELASWLKDFQSRKKPSR